VQSFPDNKYKRPLSVGGGNQTNWRSDGKEFFYIAPDGWLMAVPIRPGSDGKSIEPGKPARLFPTHLGGDGGAMNTAQSLVSDDGQRFLMNTVIEEPGSSPITIIFNWRPERGK
jgi:hypothetical protein